MRKLLCVILAIFISSACSAPPEPFQFGLLSELDYGVELSAILKDIGVIEVKDAEVHEFNTIALLYITTEKTVLMVDMKKDRYSDWEVEDISEKSGLKHYFSNEGFDGIFTLYDYKTGEKQVDPSYKPLLEYKWGSIAKDTLESVGIKDFTTAKIVDTGRQGNTFTVEVNLVDGNVVNVLFENLDDKWQVTYIMSDGFDKHYYIIEDRKYTENGLLTRDIYSYELDEIIEKSDQEAISRYYQEKQLREKQEREINLSSQKGTRLNTFLEIYNAYKNNELSAEKLYKGNTYDLYGVMDGITDGGVTNTLFNTITVTMKINYNGSIFYAYCSFDNSQRNRLEKIIKGDEIYFSGKCVNWGNWTDCVLQ